MFWFYYNSNICLNSRTVNSPLFLKTDKRSTSFYKNIIRYPKRKFYSREARKNSLSSSYRPSAYTATACTFLRAFTAIPFASAPNFNVLLVSAAQLAFCCIVQITMVFEFSVKQGCSILVSLESLKFTYPFRSLKFLTAFVNASKLLLIFSLSFFNCPTALVAFMHSLPAKSTRLILALYVDRSTFATSNPIRNIVCEREEYSFMLLHAVLRLASP